MQLPRGLYECVALAWDVVRAAEKLGCDTARVEHLAYMLTIAAQHSRVAMQSMWPMMAIQWGCPVEIEKIWTRRWASEWGGVSFRNALMTCMYTTPELALCEALWYRTRTYTQEYFMPQFAFNYKNSGVRPDSCRNQLVYSSRTGAFCVAFFPA